MGISVITLLPTLMISKCIINGQKIDYEKYLTEVINCSPYFMKLTNHEKFIHIAEQSNGEADVKTSNYELDFKLLVNSEFVNNKLKSLPKVDYSHLRNGYISMQDKMNTSSGLTQAKANGRFAKFFNALTIATEDKISLCENDKSSDLYSVIKMIKKEKNLLIFLPCEIECTTDRGLVNTISRLKNIFRLRDRINKDTFLIVLHRQKNGSDEFYLLKYDGGVFNIVDKVNRLFITTFNDLYKLTSFTENR